MPFVEHDRVVLGQYSASRGDVREVESVVGDHEIRLTGSPTSRLGEARRDEGATPPGAAVGAHGKLCPECGRRLDGQLRAVARLGLVEPPLHCLPRLAVSPARHQERLEPLELAAAEVVLPSLENGDGDLAAECCGGERHVLREQLLLQGLRRRCDDDAAPRLEGRHQIREALANPCSRLGHQVLARGQRLLDGRRERGLLGPWLVVGQGALERAPGTEERADDVVHLRPGYASERTFPGSIALEVGKNRSLRESG